MVKKLCGEHVAALPCLRSARQPCAREGSGLGESREEEI